MDRIDARDVPIKIYGTVEDSIVDGDGLRFGVFLQGCPHHCLGCHNPASHDVSGGVDTTVGALIDQIEGSQLDHAVTISGGEPFLQGKACYVLARELNRLNYDLWIYSGYLYEDLASGQPDEWAPLILEQCHVLVDGPFVERLNSYDLLWKGSSNQRVIDLEKTRHAQQDVQDGKGVPKPILWEAEELPFEPPSSW